MRGSSVTLIPHPSSLIPIRSAHALPAAPIRDRAQPLSAGGVERRGPAPWLRAGGSDSRAGARAGPDAAPSRPRLSRRRSRAPVRGARRRGRCLHQLRIRREGLVRADASAHGDVAAAGTAHETRARAAGVRPEAWRRASTRRRPPLRARPGHQLLGGIVAGHHVSARRDALPRADSRREARSWRPHLHGTRPGRPASFRIGGRRSIGSSTSSCGSMRRCRARACRWSSPGCAMPCRTGERI